MDPFDVSAVGSADNFFNLLTGYKTVTFDQVIHYQDLVITFGVDVDVKTSTWLLHVFIKSTEESLSVQVKQTYGTPPDSTKVAFLSTSCV